MALPDFMEKYNTENFKRLNAPEFTGSGSGSGYDYIAKLLTHPVDDGRHRILWMVISPYVANVMKNMTREKALDIVRIYLKLCNELDPTDAYNEEKIVYYVERAKRDGLMPPHLETIKNSDPDLYAIITKAIGE